MINSADPEQTVLLVWSGPALLSHAFLSEYCINREFIFSCRFRPVFFCPVPNQRKPLFVSIISQKQPELLNSLKVLYNVEETNHFTVCLSPLYFNVSIHYELVQWLELNKILGVNHFFVYNYSTVGNTDVILNHYANEGWLKVIPWHIPNSDLHNYGQMAMINDCLFRNYKSSKYIINTDMDEYIVPRRGIRNLMSLVKEFPSNYCEYNVRSSFLVSQLNTDYDGKEEAKQMHLDVLLKLLRREYIFPKNVRSKYIANTSCIDTAGIHYNWKYRTGDAKLQRYHVMPHDALLFHFRDEPVARNGREVEEKSYLQVSHSAYK